EVLADNIAKINSTVSNVAQTITAALYGASGSSYGLVISGNKAAGKATAYIDQSSSTINKIKAAAGVTVAANDETGIYSNAKLVVDTQVTNDGGATVIQETLNDLYPADYQTGQGLGPLPVYFGDRVRLADDYGSADVTVDPYTDPDETSTVEAEQIVQLA